MIRTFTQLRAEQLGHFIQTRSVLPGLGMYIMGMASLAARTTETTERESQRLQCSATLPTDGGITSSLNRDLLPCGSAILRG